MLNYIVLTRNSERTLDVCLKSIRKYANPNRIIIIDQHSTDNTLNIAKKHHCLIICHKNLTIGAAYRLGAKVASTPVIAYVDHDVELISTWHPELADGIGLITAHYQGNVQAGTGFGCTITRRDLILSCEEMDDFGPQADTIFQRFLKARGLSVLELPIDVIHHNLLTTRKFAWYGAWSRKLRGFHLSILKQIVGGAILGIRQSRIDDSYIQNWKIRMNYLVGYLFPNHYATL